ncbi:hypothetical protein FJT64_023351 [Amphibalanus amphitrite]|uniref:Tyr recombinase domain-containing protein n=1 Tax=Amphibalanus amphitrite TaxID=1232801 RepID=A0A6A4WMA1_AMPAM|nr:hypothetical protein FJT64_023351 [Amphibalanus amphitrite]
MLVPVILPDLPSQSVTPQRVLLALSSEELACEGSDGWMTAQLEQQQRTASSLKEDVRRFRRFVGWIDISLERFGLEHERPRMTAIDTRLKNWMAALRTQRWEVERHQRRQQQAVIPMEEQNQFLESDYVTGVLKRTPEADLVVYKEAKESRDVLMTTLLVWCAGRPSHVTGITVDNLREAKLTTIEETAMRLIRNTHFKTAATCTLDVAVPQEIWRRLLIFAERERPALCSGLQEVSDKLFVSRAGTHIDTSNANKIFKTVWSAAFGVHGSNFTARGGRFGAVMAVAERNPEDQEGVAAAMGHDVGTALRFYDVHGVSGKNKRLTGVAALLRFRKNKLALDPVMSDGETPSTATAAVPPATAVPPSVAVAAVPPSVAVAAVPPSVATTAVPPSVAVAAVPPSATAAVAVSQPSAGTASRLPSAGDAAPPSAGAGAPRGSASGRNLWSARETQILLRGADGMIRSGKYNAGVLFMDPAVREGLAGKTRDQVYNKFKYMRKCYVKEFQ